jgi:hypothetical protein
MVIYIIYVYPPDKVLSDQISQVDNLPRKPEGDKESSRAIVLSTKHKTQDVTTPI